MKHEKTRNYKVALAGITVLSAFAISGQVQADDVTKASSGDEIPESLVTLQASESTPPETITGELLSASDSGQVTTEAKEVATTAQPTEQATDSNPVSADTNASSGTPVDSSSTSEPTNPAQPSDPVDSSASSDQTTTSKDPEQTANTGSTDSTTAKPEPSKPADQPATSEKPATPSKPTTPAKPEKPATPSKPKPSVPAKPQNPAPAQTAPKPAEPVAPAQSSKTPAVSDPVYTPVASVDTPPYYAEDNSSVDISDAIVYTGETLKEIQDASKIEKVDTSSPEKFIESISKRVQVMAGKNNLYASIIIAQAILESGYGNSNLFKDDFNIFNIKGTFLGNSVAIYTIEYDAQGHPYQIKQDFRSYANYEQSLADYITLMLKGTTWNEKIYAGTWKTKAKTYQEAAKALQGVYATDPEYANKLIEIIQQYKLYQYDNVTMQTQIKGSKIPNSPVLTAKLADSKYPEYNGLQYPGAGSYAFGNCTQYVYNRIFQLGGYVGQFFGNGGEWGVNAAKQGYFTTSVPTEGYAVSFPPGVGGASAEYGHVAFVEKVFPDGSILVSEMNVQGLNVVSERIIDAGSAALSTYIQPK